MTEPEEASGSPENSGLADRTEHSPESIAYRLENEGKAFVITGDSGYAKSVVELARSADTMLIDCSFPDCRPMTGYLTPQAASPG